MLAKNRSRTEEEFERGAARSASLLGASVNALQEILDPAEARAKEVKAQLKQGSYNIKQREGKAEGENLDGENYE
jgi:diadenosine tetraphosphate (Ap4A) HIT family hydrolase